MGDEAATTHAPTTTTHKPSSAGSFDESFTWMAPMIATAVWGAFLLPVITKVINSEDPWKIKEKIQSVWYGEEEDEEVETDVVTVDEN